MQSNPQPFAALLGEHTVEFFTGDKPSALFNGQVMPIDQLPEYILLEVEKYLESIPDAVAALKQLQVTDRIERLNHFISCRFGGFDFQPDYHHGKFQTGEYSPCPLRGRCPHEFKLCSPITSDTGVKLTHREIQMIKLIASDFSESRIALEMGISLNTVKVHKANIREKLGVYSEKGIVAFAHSKNIVSPSITVQ